MIALASAPGNELNLDGLQATPALSAEILGHGPVRASSHADAVRITLPARENVAFTVALRGIVAGRI